MVSVFEGQLGRTWFFNNKGRKHVINLYHDTITGVRSATLDFQEIPNSTGNSSILMDSQGHRIFFSVDECPGFIEIRKSGWTGFSYLCMISNSKIPEATEGVAQDQSEQYRVAISETTLTPDELSEFPIVWYVVKATRLRDEATTTLHRRFKDFAELNSQVKQNLKGHHLRESLPLFPEKPLKQLTDHRDPQFIQERRIKLEVYLTALICIPHVSDMVCTKAFLGLMDNVREYSVNFIVPQLGLSLVGGPSEDENNYSSVSVTAAPVVVESIMKPDSCVGVSVGDTISKINGLPVIGMGFRAVIRRMKALARPVIIHFIQQIDGRPLYSAEGKLVATPPPLLPTPASPLEEEAPVSPVTRTAAAPAATATATAAKAPSSSSSSSSSTSSPPPVPPPPAAFISPNELKVPAKVAAASEEPSADLWSTLPETSQSKAKDLPDFLKGPGAGTSSKVKVDNLGLFAETGTAISRESIWRESLPGNLGAPPPVPLSAPLPVQSSGAVNSQPFSSAASVSVPVKKEEREEKEVTEVTVESLSVQESSSSSAVEPAQAQTETETQAETQPTETTTSTEQQQQQQQQVEEQSQPSLLGWD